jgi:hypothetical protein
MKLLTTNNAKTIKGEKKSYKTYILYLAPHTQNDKGINVCSHASKGCIESCLFKSGFGGIYTSVEKARRAKTDFFLSDRVNFLLQLKKEISAAIKNQKPDEKICFRLNGTSDLSFEKFKIENDKNIFELFPNVQFYDYTKNYIRLEKRVLPKNYHITFSRSETNEEKAIEMLNLGYNVAAVFDQLPQMYKGFKVVNGDENDLRFLDEKNVIIGLKYKKLTGKGADNSQGIKSNFVIHTTI